MPRSTWIALLQTLTLVWLPSCYTAPTSPGVNHVIAVQGDGRDPLRVDGIANVLVFVTSDCPIANSYAPEISAITRAHADDDLRFYLVHVDPDITPAKALTHAKAFGLELPIYLDPGHELVSKLGITITPEVAILTGPASPAYRGRIDDLYSDLGHKRRTPRTRDLRAALQAVLSGQPIRNPRTTAIGCDIPDPDPERN